MEIVIGGAFLGEFIVKIGDSLERDFRDEVFRKYYLTQNGTQLAVEEALKEWIEKQKNKITNTI